MLYAGQTWLIWSVGAILQRQRRSLQQFTASLSGVRRRTLKNKRKIRHRLRRTSGNRCTAKLTSHRRNSSSRVTWALRRPSAAASRPITQVIHLSGRCHDPTSLGPLGLPSSSSLSISTNSNCSCYTRSYYPNVLFLFLSLSVSVEECLLCSSRINDEPMV